MIEEYITTAIADIDKRLDELVDDDSTVVVAAQYSLLAPSKRLRPIITIATAEALGVPRSKALDAACALEMIHTYSLIHDDLPCMDDDDIRRGKPSLHKAYDEGTAVLAGDYLLTYAFEVIAKASDLSPQQKISLVEVLSRNSGASGMIGGQALDIAAEGHDIDIAALKTIHSKKTAALIAAAAHFGAIIGDASEEITKALTTFATTIGLAFQVVDDILDITTTTEQLGKPAHSDTIPLDTSILAAVADKLVKRNF